MLQGIAGAIKVIDIFDMGRGKYNKRNAKVKVSDLIDKATYEKLLDEYEAELIAMKRKPISREASSKKYTSLSIPYIYPALKIALVDGKPSSDYIPIKEKICLHLGLIPLTHCTSMSSSYYEPLDVLTVLANMKRNLELSAGEEFLMELIRSNCSCDMFRELLALWEKAQKSPEDKELVENFRTFEEKHDAVYMYLV